MSSGMKVAVSRRSLLAATAVSMPLLAYGRGARAQAANAGPFKLDPLPYASNALEPHIDAMTMEIHHDRHHAAYVANLNAAVKDHSQIAAMPLHDILAKLGEMPESIRPALRNNGGGHMNHRMFWTIMGAPSGNSPGGALGMAISRDFGSIDGLQTKLNDAGARQFGSGWAFVTVSGDGKLAVEAKPNQDTPMMDRRPVLLGNDVWEHAYYLKYQNRRADYLKAWWNVVNWQAVEKRYTAIREKKWAEL